MKLFKSSLAGVAALALASAAMATVSSAPHVYITGSTAFRGATMTAIQNVMDSGFAVAYDATSLTGATRAIVYGTLNVSGHPEVTIKAYWSGSAAGVQTVSQGLSLTEWMSDATPLTGLQATFTKVAAVPTIAMSDTAQGISGFATPALKATKVGVIPFAFVKGRVASTSPIATAFNGFTNINAQQAQGLLTNGIDLAQLTGAAADAGNKVYVLGRNPESGTRLTTFAETGFGTTSGAVQVLPTTDLGGTTGSSTTGQTIQDIIYYPAGTVNGIFADDGNNGFSSGGTLADVLSNTVSASANNDVDGVPFGLIGYLGVNDASRAIKGMNGTTSTDVSHILSYNGVSLNPTYSTATQAVTWDFTPVKEGKYTYWSYEYLMYPTALTGTAKTTADTIAARILSTDASVSGILLSDMHAARSVEGGLVTHN